MSSITGNPFLESALYLSRQGFRVFPCRPGLKEPLNGLKWVQQATQDWRQIQAWWEQVPNANIGVVADDWIILDVDRKPGKPSGFDTLAEFLTPVFPHTPTVWTPNRGMHLYFRKPFPQWVPATRRGPGFDVQAGNAYVLAPPSQLDPEWADRVYRWEEGFTVPVLALPAGLTQFLGHKPEQAPRETIDMSSLLEPCETPHPNTLGWKPELRAWWDSGDARGYEDDRSAAVQGLTAQLYRMRFDDQQVLSILWCHGDTFETAMDPQHNSSRSQDRALAWLWLGCQKARQFKPPEASEVFQQLTQTETPSGETAEALYARLYERVQALKQPNVPETLWALSEVLAESLALPDPAKALLATTIGDANLGMTRKQAENFLFPKSRKKTPAGGGESGEWGLAKLTDHIWVGHLARFFNVKSGKFLTRDGFKGQYAHLVGEDQSPEDLVNAYVRQEKTKVEAITFRPELEPGPLMEDGELKWNIGAPLALEPVAGDWSPYLALFDHMQIAEAERNHVLDFMAWMLQHPGERIRHALVIGGRSQGTGKDTLLVPLKEILGKRYVHELKGRNLNARFNSYLLNKRLVLVQEAHQEDRRAARAQEHNLKMLFTSDEVEVEPKGVDTFMVRNYAHWVITTNETHPLHISAGDRRYAMVKVGLQFETPQHRRSWTPYWQDFYAWMRGGGCQMVMHELLARDLSHFNPNEAPPETVWHEQIAQDSLNEAETYVHEAIEDGIGVLGFEFFTLQNAWQSVRAAYPQVMSHGRPISEYEVAEALRHLGYDKVRFRFFVDGVRHQPRVWTQKSLQSLGDPGRVWSNYVKKVAKLPELTSPSVVPFHGPGET